jgi:hypothetical protein
VIAVAAIVALLLLPLLVLRGWTLVRCYAAQLTLALFAWILWRRLIAPPELRFACVALAVLELALFAMFLARGTNVRWSANRAAIVAAIVYALVIAVTSWKVDGDETYYLLISDSIVRDGDLDLANQYGDRVATAFARPDVVSAQPDDPKGARGEQYSRHEPFLSLLLAPGYAAAGLHGALALMALFGALLVRSTIRWIEDEGVSAEAARAVFPLFAFGPPVLFYATRVWPEVPAAFFFVEAVRGMREQKPKRWMSALFGLVMLKLRFILVAVMLVVAMPSSRRLSRQRLAAMLAVILAPLAVMWLTSGATTSVHTWRELLPSHPLDYVRGLFGLLLDGMSGIAFQAPFYLFGIAALLRWRNTPRGFRLGMFASVLYVLLLLPRQESFSNYAPPLRYLVFLLPILALGAAAMWERIPRAAVAIVSAWTIGLVIHGIAWPWRLFHEANGENAVGEWLSRLYGSDFSRLFPSFVRINAAAWIGAIVLVLLLLWLARRADEGSPVALQIAILALVLALGFLEGRKPGTRIDFEDAHVLHDGGHVDPPPGTMNRGVYRGGWVIGEGQSLTFRARPGTHDLRAITGLGATIELGGHAYRIEPSLAHRTIRVTIPASASTTLRCVSGAVNLDRMELRHE